ncbi:MAG: acetyl-CoA C-acyltransferase [Cyclobacteriaceae bacterium]|nr:acetyl-CoA C-acyltransferase [Cyclobacteriaceae bacterium]
MKEVFVIDAVRSPVGKIKGSLSHLRADDLAAHAIRSLLKKLPDLPSDLISDVIMGCANQAGEDNRNIARMALLLAGLPYTVPGETVNRLCASGMSAVIQAARLIRTGDGEMAIAGGVEHMTRSPLVMSKATTAFGGDVQVYDSSFGWRFINPVMHKLYGTDAMGMTAENLVDLYKISRGDQDAFALRSQLKAAKAQTSGRLATEIAPVEIPQGKGKSVVFVNDEFIKADSSAEGLAKLKPAFKPDGTVTAGNASGLNDGAAALLLASETALKQHWLKAKARIVSSAVVGVEPRIMGIGPVEASNQALKKAGLTMKDIDIIELNEAFAAQCLACIRAWGLEDDDPRINPNGGAIALGHPLGMSGARIIQTATEELIQQKKRYALVTMCIGVGQGYAVILERA